MAIGIECMLIHPLATLTLAYTYFASDEMYIEYSKKSPNHLPLADKPTLVEAAREHFMAGPYMVMRGTEKAHRLRRIRC